MRGRARSPSGPRCEAIAPPFSESHFERVCRTICRVCQIRVRGANRPLGEGHLRTALRELVRHYHEERPHQGLGSERIAA